MDFDARLKRYLPPFLRPAAGSILDTIVAALAVALRWFVNLILVLLKCRGAAWRTVVDLGMFGTRYYTEYGFGDMMRLRDLRRLARSRLVRSPGDIEGLTLEERLQQALGLEVWDGSRQRYSVTGDISQWGTIPGIKRELERTGLDVEIWTSRDDHDRWIILEIATSVPLPEDDSMLYAVDTAPDPDQRQTKLYEGDGEYWGLWIRLTNLQSLSWYEDDVLAIVRDTKPAHVRAWVLLPDAVYWLQVD